MSTAAQLGYLGLEVSDLGAWRRFARGVLGLAIGAPRLDGAVPLRMGGHTHPVPLRGGGADAVAYVGGERGDRAALDALAGRLERAGVTVRAGSAAEIAARGVEGLLWF